MPTDQATHWLPDLARCHSTHLSFCLSGVVDRDLLESVSQSDTQAEASEAGVVFLGCEYSRARQEHRAILVVEPWDDEEAPGSHIIVQCEPRGMPGGEDDFVVVRNTLIPRRLLSRIKVSEFVRVTASVQFADQAHRAVYVQARFQYPLEEYRPYIDLPIRQEQGIEIRGMRFATEAPSAVVIVDLGDEAGDVLYVNLWSQRELAGTVSMCQMALQAACSDAEAFVTRRGEEKAQ